MHLNHPQIIPLPHGTPHGPWKDCLPQNQSLVPKRLGATSLEGLFKHRVLGSAPVSQCQDLGLAVGMGGRDGP